MSFTVDLQMYLLWYPRVLYHGARPSVGVPEERQWTGWDFFPEEGLHSPEPETTLYRLFVLCATPPPVGGLYLKVPVTDTSVSRL